MTSLCGKKTVWDVCWENRILPDTNTWAEPVGGSIIHTHFPQQWLTSKGLQPVWAPVFQVFTDNGEVVPEMCSRCGMPVSLADHSACELAERAVKAVLCKTSKLPLTGTNKPHTPDHPEFESWVQEALRIAKEELNWRYLLAIVERYGPDRPYIPDEDGEPPRLITLVTARGC
jgi:hypothetical protein